MNTASPIVSNTHSAGSGIRPKVGRTERSHPNTSPITSAPPLDVRVSGKSPMRRVRRPTRPPTRMPRPTKTTSVSLDGRSMYPNSRPTRSTSAVLPARRSTSPRCTTVSSKNGISSPPRMSFTSTTPRPCSAARSASSRSAKARFVTTTSAVASGESRSSGSATSTPIAAPAASQHASASRDGDDVALTELQCRARGYDHAVATELLDEYPRGREGCLDVVHAAASRPNAVGAAIPFMKGRDHTDATSAASSPPRERGPPPRG